MALAFRGFLRGGGCPRWCSQARDKDAFRIACGKRQQSLVQDSPLRLPGRGRYRLPGQPPYAERKPVSVPVYRAAGPGSAASRYQVPATRSVRKDVPDSPAGLARNVGQIALSQGTLHEASDVAKLYKQLDPRQRKRARPPPKSQRRARTPLRMQRTWRQIRKSHQTWCHRTRQALAAAHARTVAAKRNMQGMPRRARGSRDKPGTNVAQKRGLHRSILRSGWGPTGGLSGLQDPCRVGRPGLHVTDVCPVWADTPGEPQVAACVCLRCLWPAYERRCAGCDQDLEARLGVRSRPVRTWRHGRPGKRQQVQADSRVVD